MNVAVHRQRPVVLDGPLAAQRSAFRQGCGGFVRRATNADGRRFVLLGAEPTLSLRAHRVHGHHGERAGSTAARVVLEERGETIRDEVTDPFQVLRELLAERAVVPASLDDAPPLPFRGGAFGYLGYELGQLLEHLPRRSRPGLGLPDLALFFHDWVLAADEVTGEAWLSVIGRGRTHAEAEARTGAIDAHVREQLGAARAASAEHGVTGERARSAVRFATPRERYLADILAAKEHIAAGDAFEICLTHRLDVDFSGDPFALYQALDALNPAPHATFLDLPEGAVVSASPERFLSLDPQGRVESRPIKGTRPRGATEAEDAALAHDLASSPKDRAENAMIVDLVRNDLGKVCTYGSVTVPGLYEVEHHPTVHQLVSTVCGQLAPGRDAVDLVRACFPPGSMTGAPKIEAMTILEHLEPTERGVYSGALGFFDVSGAFDLSVVIRTVLVKDGRAYVHVGGAIVADSDPVTEHDETLHKARASLVALERTS